MNTELDTTFTLSELLEALQGAQTDDAPPDGIRAQDLAKATGISYAKIHDQLRTLIEAGRVECVKVPFRRNDGVIIKVAGYRVKR